MKYIFLFFASIFYISCVQEMRDVTIHFQVDMSAVENVVTVGVIGESQPLSWDSPTSLADNNEDGIYEGIISIKVAYNYSEFKFMLNEQEIELKDQRNRIVRFTDKTEVEYLGVYDVLE